MPETVSIKETQGVFEVWFLDVLPLSAFKTWDAAERYRATFLTLLDDYVETITKERPDA